MKDVEIQYYFPYFGPFLWTSKINPDISKYILEKGKEQKFNFRAYLAGQIKKEFLFDKKIAKVIWKKLTPYFESYFHAQRKHWRINCVEWKPLNLWINYQQQNEYNPQHIHSGDYSFVVYCDVPTKLKNEIKKRIKETNCAGPGCILFSYGDVDIRRGITQAEFIPENNLMLMFPSYLKHQVYPFTTKCTRVSISGNMDVITKSLQ
tara:strand:- start:6352 stop:6969 length:618 start_codon:yes stop_codon:yes gene_type:complete